MSKLRVQGGGGGVKNESPKLDTIYSLTQYNIVITLKSGSCQAKIRQEKPIVSQLSGSHLPVIRKSLAVVKLPFWQLSESFLNFLLIGNA